MSIASRSITVEELLRMPDDGLERDLIRGELREKPMTPRSSPHCYAMTMLAFLWQGWVLEQPKPSGCVLTGDARIRLRKNPDTFVGADLLYLSPEQATRRLPRATFFDGAPTLVVEILSPSDTIEDVEEKIRLYLNAGVAHLWIVNPLGATLIHHRPGKTPVLLAGSQEFSAEPDLPGFRAPVEALFES